MQNFRAIRPAARKTFQKNVWGGRIDPRVASPPPPLARARVKSGPRLLETACRAPPHNSSPQEPDHRHAGPKHSQRRFQGVKTRPREPKISTGTDNILSWLHMHTKYFLLPSFGVTEPEQSDTSSKMSRERRKITLFWHTMQKQFQIEQFLIHKCTSARFFDICGEIACDMTYGGTTVFEPQYLNHLSLTAPNHILRYHKCC